MSDWGGYVLNLSHNAHNLTTCTHVLMGPISAISGGGTCVHDRFPCILQQTRTRIGNAPRGRLMVIRLAGLRLQPMMCLSNSGVQICGKTRAAMHTCMFRCGQHLPPKQNSYHEMSISTRCLMGSFFLFFFLFGILSITSAYLCPPVPAWYDLSSSVRSSRFGVRFGP